MNELSSRLRPLQEAYAQHLPDKLDQLESLWHKLLYVDWRQDLFALLQRMTHNLAAGGASFGFPELSESAAQLDQYLQDCLKENQPPRQRARQHISAALAGLRARVEAERGPEDGAVSGSAVPPRRRPLLLVVDWDPECRAFLEQQLSLDGYAVQGASDLSAALAVLGAARPAAVLMAFEAVHGDGAGSNGISELRDRAACRTPVLLLSARTDMTARLEALRAGGDGYFTKPVDIDALRQRLSELLAPAAEEAHRVLVLERDGRRAEAHCAALESVGMVCRRLRNGLQLIEEIVQFRPDLVLMEQGDTGSDGLELAAAVRQDAQFVFMPIVFTVTADDPQLRDQALRHGVDDVIAADAPAAELAACVHERIHSAARVSARARMLSVRDPLTGTMNRRCFLEHVDRAFAGPSCAEQRLGMLYIAVDDVEGLRRELGTVCFRALASELARRVQGVAAADDTVAYFGNGILTLLGQRREPAGLGGLAHAILTAFTAEPVSACGRSVRVGCSIGVAAPAGRLRNGTSLLTRAEHAAAVAQERGGSQVCEYVEADDAQAGADDAGETDSRIARAVEARAFRLAYQPIISLHGEHEQMYEAFLRLLDEQGSVLLPAAFLAQLRGATQMVEVDRWVIEHAIETLAADRHTRGRTRFFIKLSGQALGTRMLPMWISNCIRNSRLIGQDRIVFEAAEPDIARDLDGAARLVQALRELHCGFAVEHFATSSETDAILARLRPEYVKLQGDAVRGVGADAAVTARVGAWIDTATAAGATPIVAQVEDTNTLAALWEMGVRYFQGHAVQPPGNRLDFDFQNAPAFAPGAD